MATVIYREQLPDGTLLDSVCHQAAPGIAGSDSGFFLSVEQPEVDNSPFDTYTRTPLLTWLEPVNATMSRCGIRVGGLVLTVLTVVNDSQVGPTVIETVSVLVIPFSLVISWQAEYFSVQPHELLRSAAVVAASGVVRGGHMPRPLTDPFGVSGVNDGVSNNHLRTISQGNKRSRSIRAEKGRRSHIPALLRAMPRRADMRRGTKERLAANRTGTLNGHRDFSLLLDRGVSPFGVASTVGASCVYCTSSLRVEAA